jgi:pilus assembly protein Flp/PilA
MIRSIRATLGRDQGASAVEYGLLVAAIAAIIVGIVFLLGTRVSSAFNKTNSCISQRGGAGC